LSTRLAAVPARRDARQSPSLRIRRATMRDLDDLVDLENRTFDYDRMSARQLRRHLGSASAIVLVAGVGSAIAGSAVLFLRSTSTSTIARLYSIAVAEAFRGRGIGESLLAVVEREARRRGATKMRLEVRTDNAAAARLYERKGYLRFGVHRRYYDDGHDALRYQKTLRPGTTRRT